ncbi:MAG: hypothetical protein Q9197_002207 [Variospora fuerteventurae]
MPSNLQIFPFLLSFSSCLSVPLSANVVTRSDLSPASSLHPRACGPVAEFYRQKGSDWDNNGLDGWLDVWWSSHSNDIAANSRGFAGAFGEWAIGNPDWSCRDDGSTDDCDFNACNNVVLNAKENETRQAYYTMESINRLHTYFTGLSQAFQTASIATALSKDSWAITFYKDKDVKSVTALKEVLNAATAVVGVTAAFAGLASAGVGAAAGAASALFAGAAGAAIPLIGNHQDDTFQKSADVGGILGQIVLEAMKGFISANNVLMHGDSFEDTGDIRAYLKDGLFLDFGGIDKVQVIKKMNAMSSSWAAVLVAITKASGEVRDDKAWYLYWWEEPGGIILNKHRYGWTSAPLGSDKLGQGDFAGVTVADIIKSSLDAYTVAKYSYSADTAAARAQDALKSGWGNPGTAGASWEGVFTIPDCDVGWAVTGDIADKQYILQPLGKDYRPHWCGPVCSGDVQTTQDFIGAANMANFQSPRFACDEDPPY